MIEKEVREHMGEVTFLAMLAAILGGLCGLIYGLGRLLGL